MKSEPDESTRLREEARGTVNGNRTSGSGTWATKLRGILALFTSAILVTVSRVSVQALDKAIPDFQLNAIRCGVAMMCMGFYFVVTKTFPKFERGSFLPVFLFVPVTSAVTIFEYTAITFIPVASAHCVLLTVALLSGLVLFTLVTKENVTVEKVVSALLCITGVVLVLQPTFIFRNNLETPNLDRDSLLIGCSLAVGTGIFATLEILIVRYYPTHLSDRNIFKALLWAYAFGTILSLVVMVIFEDPQIPTGSKEYLLVICHTCTYVFILPLLMYGSSVTSGNTANIISTSSIIAMLAAQYTILKDIHPGHRNWIEVLGVLLVLLGSIVSSIVDIWRGYQSKF